MTDRQRAPSVSNRAPVWALLAAALAGLCATGAAALPLDRRTLPAVGVVLVEDRTPAAPATSAPGDQAQAPFAELNASLAAARARLEELSKAAAVLATAGQARQELAAAQQENERLHAQLATLQQAGQTAEARIAELTKAAEEAAAQAKRIEQELVTMRWQNAQLNTSLARAQAARDHAVAEAQETEKTLSAKVETLSKSAEQSASETAGLRSALAEAQHRLEAATSARAEAEARFAELQEKVQNADAQKSRLEKAESERDEAQKRLAELAPETDRLRSALASAEAEVEQITRDKDGLEQQVVQLRSAAGSAAEAARQNLLAVEARIKELNAALVADVPAAATAKLDGAAARTAAAIPAAAPAAATVRGGATGAAPRTSPPTPAAKPMTPVAEPDRSSPAVVEAAARTTTPGVDADLELLKSARAGEPVPGQGLTRATADLPWEQRLQVQGLLADLSAKVDARGLALTVPGQGLFATNSDEIEPTAHDTLAKVAELIDAYKGHPVRIIGYTDSIGDASYNKILAQRRATLVKQFFIDNFAVDGRRLSTEGRGEEEPVASNDTPAGRQANRRVEVLILN